MGDNETLVCPRFVTKRLPRSLGWVLFLFGLLFDICMIASYIGEHSVIMIILTTVLVLFFTAMTLIGILTLMAPREKLHFSKDRLTVTWGKLVLRTIPTGKIRSVVSGTREFRMGFTDGQLVMLQIYQHGGWLQNHFPFWVEWSPQVEDALRRTLPNIELLL